MRSRTLKQVVDPSVDDITLEFGDGIVRDVVVDCSAEDDVFAGLPDEWPEPTDADRERVDKHHRFGNQLSTGF